MSLARRQFEWNVDAYFLGKLRKHINLLSAKIAHSDINNNKTNNKSKSQMWITNMNPNRQLDSPTWIANEEKASRTDLLYGAETANGTQEHTFSYTVTFKSINQQTFMHTCWIEPCQVKMCLQGMCKQQRPRSDGMNAKTQIRPCACVGWIWICAFCTCLKTPFFAWCGPTLYSDLLLSIYSCLI